MHTAQASHAPTIACQNSGQIGVAIIICDHSCRVVGELTAHNDDRVRQRGVDVKASTMYGRVVQELHLLQDDC